MDQKEQILHYHRVDGLSLREISRRVGLNRKTVTRYIREYEDSIREDPEEGLDICLASKPKYPARHVECTRMTEPVCAEIEYWLHGVEEMDDIPIYHYKYVTDDNREAKFDLVSY